MARDAFQLVQEAVALWEGLNGVARVDVVEQWLGNTSERGFLARVAVEGQPKPVFIEFTLVDLYERMEDSLDDDIVQQQIDLLTRTLYEAKFKEKVSVRWRDEGWE